MQVSSGKEVVQLYVRDTNQRLLRPIRELKAFKKNELNPNEERKVSFSIQTSFFEYYDIKQEEFLVSGGTYILEIGSSSRNIVLSKEFVVQKPIAIQEDNPYFHIKKIEDIKNANMKYYTGNQFHHTLKPYPFTLDSSMLDVQAKWIGRIFVYFGIKALKKRSTTEEEFYMNQYTFLTGPIRMIGMGVKKTNQQLEGIVDILNGKIIRGMIRFLKKDKRTKKLDTV